MGDSDDTGSELSDGSDFSYSGDSSTCSSVSSLSRVPSRTSVSTSTKRFTLSWLCQKFVSNGLTSEEDKWIFLSKVILVTLLPVVSLIAVSTRNIVTSSLRIDDVTWTMEKLHEQAHRQTLIAGLQSERAIVSSRNTDSRFGSETEFIETYIRTDRSLEIVVGIDGWTSYWSGLNRIDSYGEFKYYLWLNRIHPESRESIDVDSMVMFYASCITHFMSEMTRKSLQLKNPIVGRSLSIGIVIARAREALGNIHALACPFFYTGRMEDKERFTILRLRAFKDDIIAGASYQSTTFRSLYDQMYSSNETIHVETLLDACMNGEVVDHGSELLDDWHRNISDYTSVLAEIRRVLYRETETELEIELRYATTGLIVITAIISLMILCVPVILLTAYKLVRNLQTFNLESTQKLRVIRDEKRQAEDVLLKMLPPSVAKQLKRRKPVSPEVFDSVSIFFSDVVGFTSISAKSTPMQVVAFLNQLYDFFDGVIDRYDVYKVETIGDAYMVTSGLPVRNGDRHAHEISAMAIDLRDGIEYMQIPHMVLHHLQLRIGIHSGPCVAGVVGNKMPRYCLFGPTVQIASKMESSGVAQKIQITRHVHQTLEKLGGHAYITEPRDTVEFEGVGEIDRFWLVGRRKSFNKPEKEKLIKHVKPRDHADRSPASHKKLQKKDRSDSSLFRKIRNATIKLLDQGKVGDIPEESPD